MKENAPKDEKTASTDDVLEVIRKKLKEANEKFKAEGKREGDLVNVSDDEKYPVFEDDTDFDEVVLNENEQLNPEEEAKQNIRKVEESINKDFEPSKELSSSRDIKKEAEIVKGEAKKENSPASEIDEEDEEEWEEDEEDMEDEEDIGDEEKEDESLQRDITDFRGEDYEDYIDARKRAANQKEPKNLEDMESKWKEKEKNQKEAPSSKPLLNEMLDPPSEEILNQKELDSRFSNITSFTSGGNPLGAPKKAIGGEQSASSPLKNENSGENEDDPKSEEGAQKTEDSGKTPDTKNMRGARNESDMHHGIEEENGREEEKNPSSSLQSKNLSHPFQDENSKDNAPASSEEKEWRDRNPSVHEKPQKAFDNVFLEKIAHLIDKKLEDFTQKLSPLEGKGKPSTTLEELISDALSPALEKWIDNNQDSILNIIEKVSEKYMAEAFSKTKAKN